MSSAYVELLASTAIRRREAASRAAVGKAVVGIQLKTWLLVVHRRGNRSVMTTAPSLPEGPRRSIEEYLGDVWQGLPAHASTMRALALEYRFRMQSDLHYFLDKCLSDWVTEHILPEASRGETRAEVVLAASIISEVASYSRAVRGNLGADALIEHKLRSWGYEITNVMRFEDRDGDSISMILDWT
eukprot:TRINITY_DN54366_c0_g1_i1.p1 TRINITY_DN54366_c0_g1~~TRINITY_DN54366_c0_g1_i1.p1  ORF type:complete len:186 (-),score=29.90 TRINITY_DN54366_c0_g1_i1:100-657(-)